jgi:hypothetical protein
MNVIIVMLTGFLTPLLSTHQLRNRASAPFWKIEVFMQNLFVAKKGSHLLAQAKSTLWTRMRNGK